MNKKPLYVFLAGCFIAALLFILTYGVRVLDPTYDAWIFRVSDPDIHQHYLGWCNFRNSQWYQPPGLMDTMSYPYKISVLWADAIPLFAIIFKCFRNILPETFQYLGLYGLISFCLTGGISALIIKKLTGSTFAALISVPFFAESFPMLQRMFYHTSLTAHYLLLIPILIWVYDGYKWSWVKKCLIWGGYFLCTVLLHPYLWFMGAVMACFVFLDEIMITKKISGAIITGVVSAILTLFGLCLMGVFYGDVTTSYALGGFESNLNTFINSLGTSAVLPALPLQSPNQYEGFGYLGLGGIILFLLAVILYFAGIKRKGKPEISRREALALIMAGVFMLFAVFPDLTLNTKLLVGIHVSRSLEKVLGTFRSNGRFIWPVVILIYIMSIREIYREGKEFGKKYLPGAVVIICLILQLFDMSRTVWERNRKYSVEKKPVVTDLENEKLMEKIDRYDHIVMITDDLFTMERCALFAARKGLTINKYYFARDINEQVNEAIEKYHGDCAAGNAPDNVIFVFDEDTMKEWDKDTDLHFYDLTGTVIGLSDTIDYPETCEDFR